jgi:hypothetical protein
LRAAGGSAPATVGPAGRTLIFYGFVILFIGTVVLGFNTDFTKPVFGWDYFHGGLYLGYKQVLNVFGTALLVGVIFMMVRRSRHRAKLQYASVRGRGAPPRPYSAGDWAFVWFLLTIVVTGFLLEGVRIAMVTSYGHETTNSSTGSRCARSPSSSRRRWWRRSPPLPQRVRNYIVQSIKC